VSGHPDVQQIIYDYANIYPPALGMDIMNMRSDYFNYQCVSVHAIFKAGTDEYWDIAIRDYRIVLVAYQHGLQHLSCEFLGGDDPNRQLRLDEYPDVANYLSGRDDPNINRLIFKIKGEQSESALVEINNNFRRAIREALNPVLNEYAQLLQDARKYQSCMRE
jgi:hypothetical protein